MNVALVLSLLASAPAGSAPVEIKHDTVLVLRLRPLGITESEAQTVADILIDSGVECILNFAPASLNVPENVKVKDVDLSRELETLSYYLANNGNGDK